MNDKNIRIVSHQKKLYMNNDETYEEFLKVEKKKHIEWIKKNFPAFQGASQQRLNEMWHKHVYLTRSLRKKDFTQRMAEYSGRRGIETGYWDDSIEKLEDDNFQEVKKLYQIAQLINQLNMGRLEKEIVEDIKYDDVWENFKMGYGRNILKFADIMQSYI